MKPTKIRLGKGVKCLIDIMFSREKSCPCRAPTNKMRDDENINAFKPLVVDSDTERGIKKLIGPRVLSPKVTAIADESMISCFVNMAK